MKTILVPVEPHAAMRSVLDAAVLLADRFGSYIEGMALGPDIPEVIGLDLPISWTIMDEKAQQDLVEQSRRLFHAFMAGCAVPPSTADAAQMCHAFVGSTIVPDRRLGSYGRTFDLTVLGRPDRHNQSPRMTAVEAALFESGRPVLLVPPSTPGTLGETVVVAWNGSTESARTVALATPILTQAQRVIILSIEGWGVEGPTAEQLARSLRRNGVPAELASRSKPRSPGEAILEFSASVRADLLIKGAYTQSRLRQMIFGGATSHILAQAPLPVLMAH